MERQAGNGILLTPFLHSQEAARDPGDAGLMEGLVLKG